jgi:hypothetical protein
MAAQELECVIGGDGADHFVLNSGQTLMAAGGADADWFIFDVDGGGTRTIWGGAGADVIVATGTPFLGIMLATVAGLTKENFHLFDKSMLGLGAAFDWSSIDVLLLNPDGADRIKFDPPEGVSKTLTAGTVTDQISVTIGDSTMEPEELPIGSVSFYADLTFGRPSWHDGELGHYHSPGFVQGYSGSVFTSAKMIEEDMIVFEYRRDGITYITSQDGGFIDIGLGGEGWNGEYDTVYDLSGASAVSEWVSTGQGESFRAHHFVSEYDSPIVGYNANWFILGGSLNGGSLNDNGSIFADMTGMTDDNLSNWLLAA